MRNRIPYEGRTGEAREVKSVLLRLMLYGKSAGELLPGFDDRGHLWKCSD
jgi:hypothetical protein